jgi:hypothetical protein
MPQSTDIFPGTAKVAFCRFFLELEEHFVLNLWEDTLHQGRSKLKLCYGRSQNFAPPTSIQVKKLNTIIKLLC